ncbi:MAG TPA: DNA polymerase IV [Chitinophagales bacterium]|nr:DNA polymerase IV [Chitinophagales bacterium]
MNQNSLHTKLEARVLFIDMNSFFASCEQQTNYWLRGRPVAVCVYTGKYGCVIAPSIEAKKKGIRLGVRLNEAMKLCPDLVPLETNPDKYRTYHARIMKILKRYSDDVIPRSIDEAVVDLTSYKNIYPDVVEVAKQIKKDIYEEVGDYLKCSIGIAPNAFLAKLASDIQKPDGLTIITPENIDNVLKKLELTDLPGIAKGMKERLNKAGIYTPCDLRHSAPEKLKAACKSIVGLHWYHRLHFQEVDMHVTEEYKNMSAMRMVSKEQRKNVQNLHDIMMMLCLTLEKRMMKKHLFCKRVYFSVRYEDSTSYEDRFYTEQPLQDGMELYHLLQERQKVFQQKNKLNEAVINNNVTSIGVVVQEFINEDILQLNIFDNSHLKTNKVRKTVYELKDKYGGKAIKRASELGDEPTVEDVIGFGNVKDVNSGEYG